AVGRDPGPLYVDCNAVSPASASAIGRAVGERYVDAGIIGAPTAPRFYASGPHAAELAELPLDVRALEGKIGQASGLRMRYAALSNALTMRLPAVVTESMVTADVLGVQEALRLELGDSQPLFLTGARQGLPGMVPKAYRWIAEMEQIATTFEAAGLTPRMLLGAADVYRLVEEARAAAGGDGLDSLDGVVGAIRLTLAPAPRAR